LRCPTIGYRSSCPTTNVAGSCCAATVSCWRRPEARITRRQRVESRA